jgi:hypothetical protein
MRISKITFNPRHPAYTFLLSGNIQPNQLILPPSINRNQFYRLTTGVMVSHTAQIYSNSNQSISTALPRIFGFDREHKNELQYSNTQRVFLSTRRWTRFATRFSKELRSFLSDSTEDLQYTQRSFADLPHPKRALRRQGQLELDKSCAWRTHILKSVNTKLKTGEYAKPGKKARNIIDLGVEASLIAGRACELLKEFMAKFRFDNAQVNFHGHMSYQTLKEAFERLINPPHKNFVFEYFSDDSCFSARCRDGVARFNVDYASCDSSHYAPVFSQLRHITSGLGFFSEQLHAALDQLAANISVRDTEGKRVATVETNQALLFSGSTLTTLINNFSQIMLAVKLTAIDWQQLTVLEAKSVLRDCARRVGYTVTIVDASDDFCKLQFLKHSPDVDGSPYVNPGVFLRTLGWSKRDIPKIRGKRTSYTARANSFEGAKIESFKYSGQTSLFQIMAAKHTTSGLHYDPESYFRLDSSNSRVYQISDESLIRRYGITHLQINTLKQLLHSSSIGTLIRCEASDIIFNVDYGYEPH